MITNKKHNKLVEEIKKYYEGRITELQERALRAERLETLLNKFSGMFGAESLQWNISSMKLNLGDDVLVYVDDLFGGKVIKQEAVKAIKIEKDGTVKTGLTKSKADKGYDYKLLRV
jgi:hypothetical protein